MNVPITGVALDPAGEGILAGDYIERPYWWEAADPRSEQAESGPLPRAVVDTLIVGGGITGVVAALKLARAGAKVVVADSQAIGEGAARRNAGYIGRTLKRSMSWLERRLGPGHGIRIYQELDDALNYLRQVIAEEGIACHHQICGRFISANSPKHLQLLIADLEDLRRKLGFTYETIDKSQVHREIASDRYFGGVVIPDLGSLHPGLYHQGLVVRAKEAGVTFMPFTEVKGFTTGHGVKTIDTSRGTVRARHLIVTTNGYTARHLEWYARRVIPFRGYMIATEILPAEVIDKVLPNRRTYLDTKLNIDFIRPAPDSQRILFGGLTGRPAASATAMVPALWRRLTTILPDLRDVRISRAWLGQCAGTFDFMPHIGSREGVHFALGYNFAGVPLGTSFGAKIAARILGRGEMASVFDSDRFPTMPFYTGSPSFVPLAMKYFDWRDRRIAGAHAKTMV